MARQVPKFDDLPPVKGMPQGCAWGVFDKDGKKDVLGTLNLLTPDVVKAAAAEVRQGISVSLNWPADGIKIPGFFRKKHEHKVLKLEDPLSGVHYAYDDEVSFNTQASSQWDSFCHFFHIPTQTAYNGFQPSIEELQDSANAKRDLPTLDKWHDRGCLAGRGVLIDFKSYAEAKGIKYNPFRGFRIYTADIEAVAAYQGVTFRPGDILIVRFGVTEALDNLTGEEQGAAMASAEVCGLDGSKEMARWLWDHQFAAVASDNLAVEAIPSIIDGDVQRLPHLILHQWCLSLLGIPLGELWYLKTLAEKCKESQQYSFLLTSVPLNIHGLVGSPPNALALL